MEIPEKPKDIKLLKPTSYDWAEKYRPQTLAGVIGHPTAVGELRDWAESWLYGIPKNKALLLYGPAGVGKTSAAYALANDVGWEIVEINASDQRTAAKIEEVAGSGSRMETLSGRKRLIIVDEADSIHGSADRGGEKAIIGVIKKTIQPIILTANELYDMSPGLRGSCKVIQFKSVSSSSIGHIIRNITEKEGVVYGVGVIEKIVENANGDLRSAINDLQAISQGKTGGIGKIELSDVITSERDNRESIFNVLGKIFKGSNIVEARKAAMDIDEDPESFIQWIDENLPLEYTKPEDLVRGYSYLERASLFLGRVRRRQNYGMWRYASVLMTSGMVVSRSTRYTGYTKFQFPSIRKTLGQTKGVRALRDSVAKKIGTKCHVGKSFARSQLFQFFKMLMKDERHASSIAAALELEPEEISFLVESKSITKNVQKIYDESRILIEKDKIQDIEIYGRFGEWGKKAEQESEGLDKLYSEEKYIDEVQEEKEEKDDKYIDKKDIKKEEKDDKYIDKKDIKKEDRIDKTQKSLFDF